MKKLLACAIFFKAAASLAAEETVMIYNDFTDALYGRSVNRAVRIVVKESQFKRSATYHASDDIGSFLTAVVIQKSVVDKLESLFKRTGGNALHLGPYEISLDQSLERKAPNHTVYRFQNLKTGLDLSFSVEKPIDGIIQMVSNYYQHSKYWRDIISQLYQDNYVVRIWAAEKIFEPWSRQISFNEALVAATLIGDKEQYMWGIADGNGLLNRAISLQP